MPPLAMRSIVGVLISPPKVLGWAGPDVVDEHDEDVRRVRRQAARLDAALVDRLLHRAAGDARRRRRRERQDVLRPRRCPGRDRRAADGECDEQ